MMKSAEEYKPSITFTEDALDAAAREFRANLGDRRIIAFYGTMGAGKTTFIAALCRELGVTEPVTSPTFAIVNEYAVNDKLRMTNDELRMTKAAIKREESQACLNFPEREQARPKVNDERKEHSSIYHFDFYRIKRIEEAYDMGFEDYLYSGHLCLIEWPELIEDLLPDDTLRVHITANPDGTRTLTW